MASRLNGKPSFSATVMKILTSSRVCADLAPRKRAAFIAGCDGVHSIVRESMGTGFPGGTYRQLFYVADVQASGPAMDGGD